MEVERRQLPEKKVGRPRGSRKLLDNDIKEKIIKLRLDGFSIRYICNEVKYSNLVVNRVLNEYQSESSNSSNSDGSNSE